MNMSFSTFSYMHDTNDLKHYEYDLKLPNSQHSWGFEYYMRPISAKVVHIN